MTQERWAQIQRVLDGALKLHPVRRAAYLNSECQLDPDLRAEVESLLGQASKLEGFFEAAGSARATPFVTLQIGEGGMGVVYSARDVHLVRDVALKFLAFPGSSEHHERFQREARAVCALNHPNVCIIHGVGEDQSHLFLEMELLAGQTLRDRIRRGPLPAKELIDLAIGMADALACAHAAGIIHRDIKPGKLFVTSSGVAKILDFGLAKRASVTDAESRRLTRTGHAVGTVAYMSPEQARGEKLDERTDLFSFGSVLYEMATGKPAFDGDTAAVVYSAILNNVPRRPTAVNPGIPPGLEAIILKVLEKSGKCAIQPPSICTPI